MICGFVRRTLKMEVRSENKIKLCKTIVAPIVLNGSETWTVTKKIENTLQFTETKSLTGINGYMKAEKRTNQVVEDELNVHSISNKIKEH